MAELNGNNSNHVLRTYVWGEDLSGSLQDAGGVGGLLAVNDYSSGSVQPHYAWYDGNGNVSGLVNASTGSASAQYGYGPFGEAIEATGVEAAANPVRWSSKYTHGESGYIDYGHRFYNPSIGRWLSKDPIEEGGGLNLYVYVQNSPADKFDETGLDSSDEVQSTATNPTLTDPEDISGGFWSNFWSDINHKIFRNPNFPRLLFSSICSDPLHPYPVPGTAKSSLDPTLPVDVDSVANSAIVNIHSWAGHSTGNSRLGNYSNGSTWPTKLRSSTITLQCSCKKH